MVNENKKTDTMVRARYTNNRYLLEKKRDSPFEENENYYNKKNA